MKNIEENKFYVLLRLPYGYKDLELHMSEEQLMIHHKKHYQGCVNGANNILKKLDKARKEGVKLDVKSTLKSLSWNVGDICFTHCSGPA